MMPSERISTSGDRFSRPSYEGIADLPFSDDGANPQQGGTRLEASQFSRKQVYQSGSSSTLLSRSSSITGRIHPWDDRVKGDDDDDEGWDSDSSNTYDGSVESLNMSYRKNLQRVAKSLSVGKRNYLPTMTLRKQEQSRPHLHPSLSLRKPFTIEANTYPRHAAAAAAAAAASISPRLKRRPFVITPPREPVPFSGAHQQHYGPDKPPTPKLSNTFEGYGNRLLQSEKEKEQRKNTITGVPISTYEVDDPSTPGKIELPPLLDSEPESRITSPYFSRDASSIKSLELAKKRLTDNLKVAKTTSTSPGPQRKSSRRKHKKKSRRDSPDTPSTQNTSPSSSQFSENMTQEAGESLIQVPKPKHHSSGSVVLADMFSWSHTPGPSGKMKKKRSSRRLKMPNEETTPSSYSSHKATSTTRSKGNMWQGDDKKSFVSPHSRSSWNDDDTIVSGTSTLRFAPIWQGYKQDHPVQAKSPQQKVTVQGHKEETVSSRARPRQQDAKSSTSSGKVRSRPAPMWREDDAKSTCTLQTTSSVATPRPEKDYRKFFEELTASYTDDFWIAKDDDDLQEILPVHSTEREAQHDLSAGENEAQKEEEDSDVYRQFFYNLSYTNELVFQDARTYAEKWKCPERVESSVSDESAQDTIQFGESLKESLKSESALNNPKAGGNGLPNALSSELQDEPCPEDQVYR